MHDYFGMKNIESITNTHLAIKVDVHDSPVEALLDVVLKVRCLSEPPVPILFFVGRIKNEQTRYKSDNTPLMCRVDSE